MQDRLQTEVMDKVYTSPAAFSNDVMQIYNDVNEKNRKAEAW